MCFDICTINIRVSIRVRGLHLVFLLSANIVHSSWYYLATAENCICYWVRICRCRVPCIKLKHVQQLHAWMCLVIRFPCADRRDETGTVTRSLLRFMPLGCKTGSILHIPTMVSGHYCCCDWNHFHSIAWTTLNTFLCWLTAFPGPNTHTSWVALLNFVDFLETVFCV